MLWRRFSTREFLERVMAIGHAIERRRRDRFIAWGVSPRWRVPQDHGALKGRQIVAAASAAATIFRLSVAASRLVRAITTKRGR